MVRGGRGQRRAAQSAQLQLWAPPMVLSLFLVVSVLLLTTSGVCELRQGPGTSSELSERPYLQLGTLGRSPLSAAAASHPPLPTQQARTRPLPAVTIQTNDISVTPGIIPDHPSQRRDRGSAGEAVEGSYYSPSPPPRLSAPVPGWLPVAYLSMRPYLREAGSDQANYMAV